MNKFEPYVVGVLCTLHTGIFLRTQHIQTNQANKVRRREIRKYQQQQQQLYEYTWAQIATWLKVNFGIRNHI